MTQAPGDGYGYGGGYGDGYGCGYEDGYGYGFGFGSGFGYGYGDGCCTGYGSGHGGRFHLDIDGDIVRIGCQEMTAEEWLGPKGKALADEHDYPEFAADLLRRALLAHTSGVDSAEKIER